MNAIGWSNRGGPEGQWGVPAELGLPADSRGLLLAEGLFETVLVLGGRAHWLAQHLQRWQEGAQLLGLAPPPPEHQVRTLLHEAIARSDIACGALRLNWCRGSGARGLQPPNPAADPHNHLFGLQLSAATPSFEPVRVIVSPTEVRSATSLLSRCKSFAYASALLARRQALQAGADDALLPSSAGGLCCGTAANLLLRHDDHWITPPLASGCLGGIMRQRSLSLGLAVESAISVDELERSNGALLLNSLGCRPIVAVGPHPVGEAQPPEASAWAEAFWHQLLEREPR